MQAADTDPNLDAFARGLATAQADAAEAKTMLRGTSARPGLLTEIEVLKSEVRHLDDRQQEARDLFGSLFRQLDTKMDSVLTSMKATQLAVAAVGTWRPSRVVAAFLLCCAFAIAASTVTTAGVAVHAYARSIERDAYQRALERGEP